MSHTSAVNTPDRFDTLFGKPGTVVPTAAPIDSRMLPLLQPAPAPYREPQALTLLHGADLVAYLKRATTTNLVKWLQARVGYDLPADWQRPQFLAVLTALLEPLTQADRQRNYDTIVANLVKAVKLDADPDGRKEFAAGQERKAAYSVAGQKGAEGTKARRQAAGVGVGSKYSDDEVRTIRWMCTHGWNDKQVAAYFADRTKPAMIWAIRTGVSYTKVTGIAATGPEAPGK